MKDFLPLLLHPKAGNVAIMTIYALNMFWWAWWQSWVDVWYWASALSITAVVTFGYMR